MCSSILKYDKEQRYSKVVNLVSNNLDVESFDRVYHLKTLNEKGNILLNLKSNIKNENYLKLAFLKNEEPYDFSRLDDEGIVEVEDKFYNLYLIICKNSYYFVILSENNFFEEKPINKLELIQKVRPFKFRLYFFDRKRIDK